MRHFSIACTLLLAASSLPLCAQTFVRSVSGPGANAQFGKACIVVPDQNGDGFADVLVGAPGFNQERGAIYCVSGAYLASAAGSATLWSLAPTANQGDRFGWALTDVGDVNFDGTHDILVGQPGYDITGVNDVGAVRLVSGSSHAILSLISGTVSGEMVGFAVAATGDVTNDGRSEVLVGAPGPGVSISRLFLLGGATIFASGSIPTLATYTFTQGGGVELGSSIASGFELDAFGRSRFVVGMPSLDSSAGADVGGVYVGDVSAINFGFDGLYISTNPGERMGTSVDSAEDYDGDGMADVVAGAPNAHDALGDEVGRVAVLSTRHLTLQTPPYEISSWMHPNAPAGHDCHFGAAVRACGDLNGDGIGDILVGAPEFVVYQGLTPFQRGNLSIYSGASQTRLTGINGGNFDNFGGAIAGAIGDLDGDGFTELVAAAPLANVGIGGGGTGVVKCYRLFPIAPATYCTGKLNSLGCTPSISYSGSPSANPSAPFLITATNFINQKNGLLFYSHEPVSVPFQGGTKCVLNPTVRTPPMSSGGAASGSSCTGAYSFDFNDWFVNGWDTTLAAGNEIYAQYWSRDPASTSHTSLSNALRFVINP